MNIRILLLAALAAFFPLRAESVSLSRTEAYELHAALTALQGGLTPENTFAAADAINVLDADAKSYRLAATKVLQAQAAAQATNTPEATAAFRKLDEDFAAKAAEIKAYDLAPFTITAAEIKATQLPSAGQAGITGAQIATIRRHLMLKPDKPKPAPNP